MYGPLTRYSTEFLGTAFFLFVILNTTQPLLIGAALAIAIYLGGAISGGNFNPAVTIMMLIKGTIKQMDAMGYIVAQVLGGMAAFWLFRSGLRLPLL